MWMMVASLAGFNRERVQAAFEVLLGLFAQVGLLPNVMKTKAIVSVGHHHPDTMSDTTFKRRHDTIVPTHHARKLNGWECTGGRKEGRRTPRPLRFSNFKFEKFSISESGPYVQVCFISHSSWPATKCNAQGASG